MTTKEKPTEPTSYQKTMLGALQSLPHMYEGEVPESTIHRRRARNKAARRSRRINRRNP